MANPATEAEGDQPEDAGGDEHDQPAQRTSLHQLAEPRDEEACDRCKNIAGRALGCHD